MKTIRGLTIRHPWPSMFLLEDEPKRLENRDWPPPKRMVGQLIALHGGVLPRPGERKYLDEIQQALAWIGEVFDDPDGGLRFSDDELMTFCMPGIFGVARLADVVQASDDPWFTGPFGWLLEDFVPINPPLPDHSPNHRGLWEIEADTLTRLRGRYRAAQLPAQPAAPAQIAPPVQRPPPAPSLFCPGAPLPPGRRLEPNRLYGVAVPGDWITLISRGKVLHWRVMRSGELGSGSRAELDSYLKTAGQQAGAA